MGIIFDVFEWFESESRKNEEITNFFLDQFC